jgi:transcription elongation factor GreA
MQSYELTREKILQLRKELFILKGKKLTEIASRLLLAREDNLGEGDDPFHEISVEKQNIEERISQIETVLKNAKQIKKKSKDTVELGSVVKVETEGVCDLFQIVSSIEAQPFERKVSNISPIGEALIGKKVGDVIVVKLKNLTKEYKILSIE